MTIRAFVLVETESGKSKAVTAAIRQLEGVKTADTVTGPYDVIAVIEGETPSDVGDLVNDKLQSVEGVTRTVLCLAM
jgi:DNA-binding Lrp family transcriptional regulator